MDEALTDEEGGSDEEDLFINIGEDDKDHQSVPKEESPGEGEGQGSNDNLVIINGDMDGKASKVKALKALFGKFVKAVKAKAAKLLKPKLSINGTSIISCIGTTSNSTNNQA